VTKNEQLISEMAKWEQQRRDSNKGKSRDDKAPAISALGTVDLANAAKTGRIEVTS
jgi:hypothetical protein